MKRLYRISEHGWIGMVLAQGGKCMICQQFLEWSLVPDHDHKTGEVRGMLCGDCNLGLGRFKDDPVMLLRAFFYLTGAKR